MTRVETDTDKLLEDAAAAIARGDTAEANRLLDLVEATKRLRRLRSGDRSGNRSRDKMMQAARVRHSAAVTSEHDNVETFLEIANQAGHTLRSVAESLRGEFGKCSHVFLLKALRGEKAIRKSWADHVQEVTKSKAHPRGYTATGANWPHDNWAREP